MLPSSTAPSAFVSKGTDDVSGTNKFRQYLTDVRRHLHMHPEVGFQEMMTSEFLQNHLQLQGMIIQGPLAETGFYVDIEGKNGGTRGVGFRCDMDALPIQDAKLVPYASRNSGIAHSCGHDVHMAVGVGIATLLHRQRHLLKGRVRIFFQPNEEGSPSGSVPMIRDGVLDSLEALYCVHVDPTLDVGIYGLAEGKITAAVDRFRVRLRAPGTTHSARPHQGKDLIWIATQLLSQFYQYAGRLTDVRNPSVFTTCMFRGGTAANVMPEDIEFHGTLRTLDNNDRAFLKQFMVRTCEVFAALHDVRVELDFAGPLPSVENDSRLLAIIRDEIVKTYGAKACTDITVPSMGSEDFAHYLDYVPGALLRMGTRSSLHSSRPLHDANFDIDEAAMVPTVRLMTNVLMRHLETDVLS